MSGVVKLANGYEVSSYHAVAGIGHTLERLVKQEPDALFQLLAKSYDPGHEIAPMRSRWILRDNQLIESDGSISENVRKMVVSSIEKIGSSLVFVNPIRKDRITSFELRRSGNGDNFLELLEY